MAKHASRNTVPTVFISSTSEDLKSYRAAARDAANSGEFLPKMMEYFRSRSDNPPRELCMVKVSEADVLVVIVAHRYGWVPSDQPASQDKSITWLECEQAAADGHEVLAFLLDDKTPWPEEWREEHDIVQAIREGKATPKQLAVVQRNVDRLREFKAWLSGRGFRTTFSSPEDLRGHVAGALGDWRKRHPEFAADTTRAKRRPADPAKYLRWLLDRTAHIQIRGLEVGTGKAHQFPIESCSSRSRRRSAESRRSRRQTRGSGGQSMQPSEQKRTQGVPHSPMNWRSKAAGTCRCTGRSSSGRS